MSPVKDAAGRVIGVSTIARDITRHKQAEAARLAAEAANQLKDEFLTTLSHELRTPLTMIVGWADMLGTSKLDPVTSLQAIEVIRRNA